MQKGCKDPLGSIPVTSMTVHRVYEMNFLVFLQLYKDLVITNIITPDEFWIQHAPKSSSQGGSSSAGSDSAAKNQEVGVAGSFMADIKPQADGANGIR